MRKILLTILICIFSSNAYSEEIKFACTTDDAVQQKDVTAKHTEIIVDSMTGDMWNYPNYLAMGCLALSEKEKSTLSVKCSIDDNKATCSCSGGSASRSTLTLSRNTGRLMISTHWSAVGTSKANDVFYTFICQKVSSKVF